MGAAASALKEGSGGVGEEAREALKAAWTSGLPSELFPPPPAPGSQYSAAVSTANSTTNSPPTLSPPAHNVTTIMSTHQSPTNSNHFPLSFTNTTRTPLGLTSVSRLDQFWGTTSALGLFVRGNV